MIILDLKTLTQLFRLVIEFVIFWERLQSLFISLIHTEKILLSTFSVTRRQDQVLTFDQKQESQDGKSLLHDRQEPHLCGL